MNVGQLRKLIESVSDDTKLVITSSDHSYREVEANLITTLFHKKYGFTEDFGDELTPENQVYGKRISVILFD